MRRGALLATAPNLLALGSGSASNPQFTGSLSADTQGLTASGAGSFSGSSGSWADVIASYSAAPAHFAVAGRVVGLDINGSDYGLRLDSVNNASATYFATGAYDGTSFIRLRPPSSSIGNSNQTYCGIANGLEIWNHGAIDVAQCNVGFCMRFGARYTDLTLGSKITGFLMSPSLGGGIPGGSSRAAVFDNFYNPVSLGGTQVRIPCVTSTTVQSYHQPTSGTHPDEGPDADKLFFATTTTNHANNPPLIGQEWIYWEQETDVRQDRGNPFGRNRLDVWARDGYLGYLEIPINHDPNWNFANRYIAYFEYLGGLFNAPGVANADNYFDLSHVRFSANRPKDARLGPPPGFLI